MKSLIPILLIVMGLSLIFLSINHIGAVRFQCFNGTLIQKVTCEFPGVSKVVNIVHGYVLVSANNGPFELLSNGTLIAKQVTYEPYINNQTGVVEFSNSTSLEFNIEHPFGSWLNFTLPGDCNVNVNVTLEGSGYFYLLIMSNENVVGFTPYTYTYYADIHAVKSLDILIKPAIPLSCPCIISLISINITGQCMPIMSEDSFSSYPYLNSVAYVNITLINWFMFYLGVSLTVLSIPSMLYLNRGIKNKKE